ncbi:MULTISPECIES: Gfo/Idh/MocA family oxidoreductase [unclassified Dyella]|uniref:Gfo/Idh/MocA family protein n=1 Tax=unclassified Dyella TaxID=2634549 RepID=UPI000C81BDAD|nr:MULTISPECIES: Gfo/Idh/MocA family oxidoreductase [unclassified Dyella]MDR3445325.1 Gfo/Idh/MocA family oxidoreductase [Dyella sp.]PMQ07061.1 1,5-anhydro-D-fructose reductase [Dyella sp. AD56]
MTTAAIRWGIIGCGNVTEVKSGPGFSKTPNSALIAVMRRDGEKARDYAERHGVPRWYDDAAKLIADPDVNAVYIATPPSTHKRYALMSIAAGKPVYVEKPMAMDHAECEAIIHAGKQANVPVFVAYYRRSLPRFQKVRELIFGQQAIGKPRIVNTVLYEPHHRRYHDPANLPWHVVPEISGGGVFMDIGCHTLDILDWLFGPIVAVDGQASNQLGAYSVEDGVAMSFAFGNGMLGTGIWNFDSFKHHDQIEVIGDKGRIAFATFGDGPIHVETADGSHEYRVANPSHIQQPLIETIVAELTGKKGACPSTAESGARTSWVMDQVLRQYRQESGQAIGG